MDGNSHIWQVEDAVRFVMARGTPRERQAFQAIESAYGGGPLDQTPASKTRIVDIVGRESRDTDGYRDLAIYLDSFWGLWQDDITEYDGHVFTALNHFLAVPWYPTCWWNTNGYHYYWSSRQGNDSLAMTGKVDTKNAEVDNDHSPVVDRCRFGWTSTPSAWASNWDDDIRFTVFVPSNVVAYYYYDRFINRTTWIDQILGAFMPFASVFLLGPVCHAIGDACMPQHAISTMDCYHQEWEHVIDTWNYGYELEDFNLVRQLLDGVMTKWVYTGGSLQGKLAIDHLISELCGWQTYVHFMQSNNLQSVDQMQSPAWWKGYIGDLAKVKADAKFCYNLAIAATARVITEACYDAIAAGAGHMSTPVLFGPAEYGLVGGLPTRGPVDLQCRGPGELTVYHRIDSVLGFRPTEWRGPASTLHGVRGTWRPDDADAQARTKAALDAFEVACSVAFQRAWAGGRRKFEPPATLVYPEQYQRLRQASGLPAVSANVDTRPNFGLGTFRVPTREEASDDQAWLTYLDKAGANTLEGKLLSITRCIALNKLFLSQAGNRRIYTRGVRAIEGLQRLQEVAIRTGRFPAERWPEAGIQREAISLDAERARQGVVPAPIA